MIDLKRFREENIIKQAEICSVLNMAQSYVSQIESGKKPLNYEKFDMLHKHYGDIILKYKLIASNEKEKPVRYYDIEASAGNNSLFDPGNNVPYRDVIIPGYGDCDIAIKVIGDSMSPLIPNGSMIICKEWKQSFIEYGLIYLIISNEDHRTIKYVHPGSSEESITCKSENGLHEPFEIEKQDILKMFIVKGCVERITF